MGFVSGPAILRRYATRHHLAKEPAAAHYAQTLFRISLPALASLCVAAALLCQGVFTPAARPAETRYVSLVMETPNATPFTTVRYEVVDRGPAVSAVHRRELPNYDESLHAMALLTRAEAAIVFDALAKNGATGLKDAVLKKPPVGAVTWRVELFTGDVAHTFRVTDPANQMDQRYQRIVEAVRRTVKRHAGELPFRNVFFGRNTLGFLNIMSIPVATVSIDGFNTKLETPMFGYEVKGGSHIVRLVTKDGRYDRSYKVKVGPGGTTRLAVDLR